MSSFLERMYDASPVLLVTMYDLQMIWTSSLDTGGESEFR